MTGCPCQIGTCRFGPEAYSAKIRRCGRSFSSDALLAVLAGRAPGGGEHSVGLDPEEADEVSMRAIGKARGCPARGISTRALAFSSGGEAVSAFASVMVSLRKGGQ